MSVLRLLIKRCLNMFLSVLRIFPIKQNRILLLNDLSYTFGCNLKYLCIYLLENFSEDFQLVYVLKKGAEIDAAYSGRVKIVRPKSLGFFYNAMCSRVLITNSGGISYLPARKKQTVINTWHGGGAYKMVGVLARDDVMSKKDTELTAKKTTYMLASSEMFKTRMAKSLLMKLEKFIDCGMPRNDLFFADYSMYAAKIKAHYGIPAHKKIVLYAPTFRNLNNDVLAKKITPNYDIDSAMIVRRLQERFGGEFVFAVRLHPMITDDMFGISENCHDFGKYPDMQELLCAADVLITDYSSSMWDFSLTKKPCFLYANDIYEYEKYRGFYTPVSSWPFSVSLSNEELAKNISAFDESAYIAGIQKHHEDFGNYEKGQACSILINIIREITRLQY